MSTDPERPCCGCLVAGRRVYPLLQSGQRDLYLQLCESSNAEMELGACAALCWECRAALQRLRAFQRQVRCSYRALREHLAQDPLLENIFNIAMPSRLEVHKLVPHSYPEVVAPQTKEEEGVKNEFWSNSADANKLDVEFIKTEPEENNLDTYDNLDHYSEPETFANSITNDVPPQKSRKELKEDKKKSKDKLKKEKHKKVKTKVKDKVKKKANKVRKVKRKLEESDGESQNDADINDKVRRAKRKLKDADDESGNDADNKDKVRRVRRKLKDADDLSGNDADNKDKVRRVKRNLKEDDDESENDADIKDDASVASVSSGGLSELESVIDYYHDLPQIVTKTIKATKEKVKVPKVKLDKELFDPMEIKLITLTHEDMLKEREKEALADYFAKCPHQCKDCILGFKYERTLLTHIETKHAESAGAHVCPVCKVRFHEEHQLAEHARRHLQRYKCNVCGKKSLSLLPMVKHARNHKEYKCDVCGQLSGSLFRHQTHMAKEHREKPQCVECGKMFSSRKTYRYHMNVIHKGQNRFPCPHCGKIYQWKSNLWRHIKNHKARDNGELYCAPCNKKFSSVATFQQHLKISRKHVTENEFNYMCSECGKKFANKTRLRDHVDWDHLKKINYRCQICDKPFKSNTSLYVHMQNVHKNKDEKDNLCHVCGKSYQNIAKLKYHIVAMHTTETPYSCEQCPSAFSWYSSLYRHVKEVHEKVRIKKKRVRRKEGAAPPAHPALPAPPPPPLHLAANM